MADGSLGGWVTDTLALYARVFRRGAVLALRNWPVGFVMLLYGLIMGVVGSLVGPFGLIGGLVFYLVSVACASSWLALVGQVIATGRAGLADLPASFGAHLSDLLTVFFAVWVLSFVASVVFAQLLPLRLIFLCAVLVFLNAVPELVYLGRHGAAELLVESYRFIGENWIEWFLPNLLLAVPIAPLLWNAMLGRLPWALEPVLLMLLYFAMIVRGLLFLELSTSSRRAREFRRRAED